jgi:hypothetical protein
MAVASPRGARDGRPIVAVGLSVEIQPATAPAGYPGAALFDYSSPNGSANHRSRVKMASYMTSKVIGSWISRLSRLGVGNPNGWMILGALRPWWDGGPSAVGLRSISPLALGFQKQMGQQRAGRDLWYYTGLPADSVGQELCRSVFGRVLAGKKELKSIAARDD